jgi:hypothetical protein
VLSNHAKDEADTNGLDMMYFSFRRDKRNTKNGYPAGAVEMDESSKPLLAQNHSERGAITKWQRKKFSLSMMREIL